MCSLQLFTNVDSLPVVVAVECYVRLIAVLRIRVEIFVRMCVCMHNSNGCLVATPCPEKNGPAKENAITRTVYNIIGSKASITLMPSRSYASSTGYQYGSAFNTRWRFWCAKFVRQVLLAISASTSSNMWLYTSNTIHGASTILTIPIEQTPNLQDVYIHTLHLSSGTVYPATSYTAIRNILSRNI